MINMAFTSSMIEILDIEFFPNLYLIYLLTEKISETNNGQPTTTTAWKAEAIPVQETQQNTVLLVIMLVLCVASIFACFAMAALCYRYNN